LISESIANICHPSDLVPLMRELKEGGLATTPAAQLANEAFISSPDEGDSAATTARDVHLVFRVRRKGAGYTWMDATGKVHVDPGKSRKVG
jgi:hypothetical protein